MAKIYPNKYPMGSFSYQKTPGRYFDDNLLANLEIPCEAIVQDMQFMALCCSSTFEVRTGKSTFMQQVGEAWNYLMETKHGIKLDFSMKNVVFNSENLIQRAFELPKYSFLILDENDEVDEHYFSKLAKNLRKFFKKSGQLNLFIMLVVPNFFQLRPNYAIGRSNFLIDVKFTGKFERGNFSFYSFDKKKKLYLEGKKYQDYKCVPPDFNGKFMDGYVVDRAEYLRIKRKDLEEVEEEPLDAKKITQEIFYKLRKNLVQKGIITTKVLYEAFEISEPTAYRWIKEIEDTEKSQVDSVTLGHLNIINNNNIVNKYVPLPA